MKNLAVVVLILFLGVTWGTEDGILLKINFSERKLNGSGPMYRLPKLKGKGQIQHYPDKGYALRLEKEGYLELQGTESLDLFNGGTLTATVRFSEPNLVAGKPATYDMIIFKENEFLLGRTKDGLYFNLFIDGKWTVRAVNPALPSATWIHVAVTLTRTDKNYVASYYINGKKVYETQIPMGKRLEEKRRPVLLGKGWGKVWLMKGDIANVSIYNHPLSDAEIADLFRTVHYIE
ncbi:MAG: LamG-like jellyroll fold domain-containing protein [Victivallales bacterium]